ncbi:MAG: hypothetical protein KKE24_09440 [Candidatus Thermoplasmatota archaeon]|nr:hypothetical protein [Candidatus Thermoplasmatota archaeon]
MKLFEWEAKNLLSRYGILVPEGYVVQSPADIHAMPWPVVIKAQILSGSRGVAGGIMIADTIDEARHAASNIIGMNLNGLRVRRVLVERKLDTNRNLFLAAIADNYTKKVIFLASPNGGSRVETDSIGELVAVPIAPSVGYESEVATQISSHLGVSGYDSASIAEVCQAMYAMIENEKCILIEFNPLSILSDNRLAAIDAKVAIDNTCLPSDVIDHCGSVYLGGIEATTRRLGIEYIDYCGEIGVISNGHGLLSLTCDIIHALGGSVGPVFNVGEHFSERVLRESLILMNRLHPRVTFLNVFSGFRDCVEISEDVYHGILEFHYDFPIVCRIKGLNEQTSHEMFAERGIDSSLNLHEAASMAFRYSRD